MDSSLDKLVEDEEIMDELRVLRDFLSVYMKDIQPLDDSAKEALGLDKDSAYLVLQCNRPDDRSRLVRRMASLSAEDAAWVLRNKFILLAELLASFAALETARKVKAGLAYREGEDWTQDAIWLRDFIIGRMEEFKQMKEIKPIEFVKSDGR